MQSGWETERSRSRIPLLTFACSHLSSTPQHRTMPKKGRGSKLARSVRGGKQKQSRTANLHGRSTENRAQSSTTSDRPAPPQKSIKVKEPRPSNLKRSLDRKDKQNKKLKLEKGAAMRSAIASKAIAKSAVAECAEKVRDSNNKVRAVRAETKAEIVTIQTEADAKVLEAETEADMVKAEVATIQKKFLVERKKASRTVSSAWADAKKSRLRAEAAEAREANARSNAGKLIDSAKIEAREKVTRHKKRAADALEKEKLVARGKRIKQRDKAEESYKTLDAEKAEELKQLKFNLATEKKNVMEVNMKCEQQLIEERGQLQEALQGER